ncbi:putative GPI anchored protein [Leptodontidium sp. MPI-SDFR-AT-0119]|nr:putative GPI anchored protein [Leptodontidium sp. MPI-SDFR-AT-0119]
MVRVLVYTAPTLASPASPDQQSQPPKCRFSPTYAQKDILNNPDPFISDFLYWEGEFHQNNVSYNSFNGMSYDGTLLDETSGLATTKHPFSAASKESLQIMIYTHALAGSQKAARFLSPDDPKQAPSVAFKIVALKLKTYLKFNETYPGFGGFIPWYTGDSIDITPTPDWVNRVPALDNGELIWAVYGLIQVLETSNDPEYRKLAKSWQSWLDYTKSTVAKVFYPGNGRVCAVTTLDQSLHVNDPRQNYTCEGSGVLNDPYEGELFTWWLYFFGGLSRKDKDLLWQVKRPQLVSVDYNMGGVGPITVQKGFWFSSHEQWKVLEMPYYDVDLVKRLFYNAERVRTCNSAVTKNPGLFASVNNSTDPTTGEIIGYISNAGIPSISFQTEQELDVITPYGVFPTVYLDKAVGMAWWKNMADGKKMQNPYGSSESARIDGTATSSFVSWDSKITTVIAVLDGVGVFVREKMKRDGIYKEFVSVTQREYGAVFENLKGEQVKLCLPNARIPDKGLLDYTQCR